jgi:hypothetical protein
MLLTAMRVCGVGVGGGGTVGKRSRVVGVPPGVAKGSRSYIPQEQGGPVIPPGAGLPFCRLLRLARTTVEEF